MFHEELKQESIAKCDGVKHSIEAAYQNILNHCAMELKKHAAEKAHLNDYIHQLEIKLVTEKEQRHAEVSAMGQKYVQTSSEKDDLREHRDNELSRLSAQVEALERGLNADIEAYQAERQQLQEHISDLVRQKNKVEELLDSKKHDQVGFESKAQAIEAEKRIAEEKVAELRRNLRESDDALAMAVNSNEHFKAQMEEQRQRYIDMNQRGQGLLRAEYEDKIMAVRDRTNGDLAHVQQQIREVDEALQVKCSEHEKHSHHVKALEQDLANHRRDVAMWKSQYETATKQRHEVEREQRESKSEFAKDKLALQEQIKVLQTKNEELQQDLDVTSQQFAEYKKETVIRDSELTSTATTLRSALKDAEAEHDDNKKKLTEAAEQMHRVRQDVDNNRARVAESQANLERDLEAKVKEMLAEKRRLDSAVEEARKDAAEARTQYERWRDQALGGAGWR